MCRRHPVTAFFALAYLISWGLWTAPALGLRGPGGAALLIAGSFGPFAAGAAMTRATGGSLRAWLGWMARLRVAPRWYVVVLGLPVALAAVVTIEFALTGRSLDTSLLGTAAAFYVPALLITAVAGGGNEEPGWRGFALPRLLARMSPVSATLLLGTVWALWHLPILFATDGAAHGLDAGGTIVLAGLTLLGIVGYAFAYTYVYAATGSVALCVLLHAGFNTAMASAALRSEEALQRWDYVLVLALTSATIWIAVGMLIVATRGRLGCSPAPASRRARSGTRPTGGPVTG